MGKHNWKWAISFFWESLPSSLQDTIRKWAWDIVLGTIAMVAYFIWRAVVNVATLPWEIPTLIGLGFFTITLYLGHFIRKRISAWRVSRKNHDGDSSYNSDIPGFLSMKDAATRLFREVSGKFVLQRARQNLDAGSSVHTDLQITAQYIASQIPIYGRRGLLDIKRNLVKCSKYKEMILRRQILTRKQFSLCIGSTPLLILQI